VRLSLHAYSFLRWAGLDGETRERLPVDTARSANLVMRPLTLSTDGCGLSLTTEDAPMTESIKPLSTEELLMQNASLHEAGKTAFEAIQRYQINLRIFSALGRSIACNNHLSDFDRPYLMIALNDAIAHAEMEVDGEVATLENCLRHETVSAAQLDSANAIRH
jgi:hypothetical protein